jgi:transcriptional regulator with XRE-family HTH domain
MDDVWRLLIERRKRRRLSQEELAQACGVRQATVSRWETLQDAPRWKHYPVLARTLGISEKRLAQDIAANFAVQKNS